MESRAGCRYPWPPCQEGKRCRCVCDDPAELTGADLKDCISNNSLSSNASLPSVQSCRRLRERRVASWAVSFERLLQDPVGVRYFSVSMETTVGCWQFVPRVLELTGSSQNSETVHHLVKGVVIPAPAPSSRLRVECAFVGAISSVFSSRPASCPGVSCWPSSLTLSMSVQQGTSESLGFVCLVFCLF